MLGAFRIDHIFFTLFGYSMSYIEFVGTILNILSVWLVTRKSVWNWPVGNVAVILFGILFYQIQLYSDLVEQIYFLITGFYGWWVWARGRQAESRVPDATEGIKRLSRKAQSLVLIITVLGSAAVGWFMSRIHVFWPALFPIPASFPYLDAWTTVMSFVAQALLVHKKLDNWYLWIMVDIVGIGLYWARGVYFVSLLYVLFLVLAVRGLIIWRQTLKQAEALA